MTNIEGYLTIAGTAQRRLIEVERITASSPTVFPNGPDHTELAQEIAACAAIVAIVRAMISTQLLQLHFTEDGRAAAEPPHALRDGEYDQGSYHETAH